MPSDCVTLQVIHSLVISWSCTQAISWSSRTKLTHYKLTILTNFFTHKIDNRVHTEQKTESKSNLIMLHNIMIHLQALMNLKQIYKISEMPMTMWKIKKWISRLLDWYDDCRSWKFSLVHLNHMHEQLNSCNSVTAFKTCQTNHNI